MSINKKYRALAILMGMLVAGSLAMSSCSSSSDNTSSTSDSGTGETTVTTENFNATGLPILNEKTTFTIAVPQKSTLKEAGQKDCVLETEEATNIHIEWTEIPASGWNEKINLMFNTDSLPDAIIGDFDIAKNYEQLAVLDSYLEQYAPSVQAFFDARPDYPEGLYAPDKTIRTLPAGDESTHNIIDAQYMINQVWLDKLGLEMPETTEEFKEVLIAFRDNDPNGNGQQDEIPFTFQSAWDWGQSLDSMFGPFGVVESDVHVFLDENNTVVFSAKQDGYYKALQYFNDLYKEGLIDKDIFTMSAEQYKAKDPEGDTVGAFAGYGLDACGCPTTANIYSFLPVLKGEDGTQMISMNNVTKTGGFAISKSCSDPAAMVRWYDYINSSLELALEWGRGKEGVFWEIVDNNGSEAPKFLYMTPEKLEANGGYKTTAEYRNAETFAGNTPSLWRNEYDLALTYSEDWPYDAKLVAVKDQMQYGVISLPAGTADVENSERRAILKTDIDTYLKKFIADSIINGIDDAKWQAHLQTLESLKVDEYTTLCQEFVDSLE